MLLTRFKNYDEYREMFYRQDGERKNKILLEFYRNSPRTSHRVLKEHLNVSMIEMYEFISRKMRSSSNYFNICLSDGSRFCSSEFMTDGEYGVCIDGDTKQVRYVRQDNKKVFKMKAGKFFRHLLNDNIYGMSLPESVKIYMCEEFARRWEAHISEKQKNLTLYVGESVGDFEYIYTSRNCVGDFDSCMEDKDLHYFYSDAVDAKAAWLENEVGDIVARCVIFNNVIDEDGKKWRLAERQYSEDTRSIFKNILVNKLIAGDHIDGYKAVGAGCSDAGNFIDIHGKSLSSKKFKIKCMLDFGDALSYQDSFKWYDYDKSTAYNYPVDNARFILSTTYGEIEDDRAYDEYHNERGYFDLISVYTSDGWVDCDASRLEDFRLIDGDWYHEDFCRACDCCGSDALENDGYYSEDGERFYCCMHCFNENEKNEDEDE